MAAARNHFYPLKVSEVIRETPEAVSIAFEVSDENRHLFQFIHGQYLTFKLSLNGEEHRRSYSICSAPYEDKLKVAVKHLDSGVVSTFLNSQLKAGDIMEVIPPQGNFYTPHEPSSQRKYVAFAAGSGITPIMSILKSTLYTEPNSHFTLVYGNREHQHIIFREELESLQAKYGERLKVLHVLSREASSSPLFEGRIDLQKLSALTNDYPEILKADHYFTCGPYEMIQTASVFLQDKGVDKTAIHYELFTTPLENDQEEEGVNSEDVTTSDNPVSRVTIELDGDETVIDLKKDGLVILDAAIAAGIDPPYSCKGGVCTTCMAKLSAGKVKLEMNHALTDSELEQGYILTCQSHPVTDEVKLSYDDI